MGNNLPPPRTLRLAILTMDISHFEVPLFRHYAESEEIELKVFYINPVKTHQFDSEYNQKIDWGYNLLNGYNSYQVRDAFELEKASKDWGTEVFLLYGYAWRGAPGIILRNWWHGRPQVHRGTLNYHLSPLHPIKGQLMRPLARWLLRLFDAHHYGGAYSRKVLLDAGVNEGSLFFIPYSIDTPHFLAAVDNLDNIGLAQKIRTDLGWQSDNQVILFIAHHNWIKGPDIAMAIFAEVARSNPKARFLIVGSGRMTDDMKTFAHNNLRKSSYHFAGFIPSSETVPYYLACDLVICTSRYETWARMVNEAMLCRRPCVVSRVVGAAGGLVEDGRNGFVIESLDTTKFIQAIRQYFSLSPQEREYFGNAAREKACEFAYEPHIDNAIASVRYAHNKVNGCLK